MAVARAGCLLLDREIAAGKSGDESEKAAVAASIEALKRWCAARFHDPAYRGWVVFRLPENVDYFKLVEVEHRDPAVPWRSRGRSHLRRRDGFTLTDRAHDRPRGPERDRLLPLLPRPRQGLVLEGASDDKSGALGDQPARHRSSTAARSTRRSPRCTCMRSARRRASARSRSS